MADDDQEENQNDDGKKAGAGKKRIAFLGVAALLIIALSVGGTLLAVQMLGTKSDDGDSQMSPSEDAAKPAIYYPIKPPITATFSVRGRQRYLQAEITLMMRDGDVLNAVELHRPMLRNALVMLISGATYEELQTAEGKELLRQQCLQELQRLLEQEIGRPGIEQVLFTNFVMQ